MERSLPRLSRPRLLLVACRAFEHHLDSKLLFLEFLAKITFAI